MKRHTSFTVTSAILLGAGALAGCGDDDTLTRAQFTEQANAICVEADARIGEAVGPIFAGEPTADELQEALDAIVATSRDTADQLDALAPPSDRTDEFDQMLVAFDAANDEAESQGLAFFETDDDPWAPVGAIAGDLGLDACAGS